VDPQEERLIILANLSNKLSLTKSSPPVLGGDTEVVINEEVSFQVKLIIACKTERKPSPFGKEGLRGFLCPQSFLLDKKVILPIHYEKEPLFSC
jgi:hypothetical protein